MKSEIFRLKSNRKTFVERISERQQKIVWSDAMERGYDARWMISSCAPDNLEKLSDKEEKQIRAKIKEFENWINREEPHTLGSRIRKKG